MAIADDVTIDYTNKIIKRDSSPSSTVYSVNALYSYIMDVFDELVQMDDTIPMTAQTPTSYTMINGWYIQEELTHFLEGGAIQTSGYNAEIRTIFFGATYTNAVAGDVGKEALGGTTGDTGTLLDYDNTAKKWWVRMDAAGDLFDNAAETVEVTTAGGTGTGTTNAVSTTGEHIFSNPYTLGTLQGSPALYVFQNSEKITSWWAVGHLDILIKVSESGVDIDSKKIWVADHTWQSNYDSFAITLTTAGQNAVPLGTSNDLNNQSTTADVEDLQDGTTATIAIDFGFTTPFSYDIGDGNGVQDYEIEIDCNSRRLSDVYEVCKFWTRAGSTKALETGSDGATVDGEEYRYAVDTYAESKKSPLGTFAGGTFFGARSVYLKNLHADDVQKFQLIDKAGTTRDPPNYQSFAVTAIVSGDRVTVFLDDGTGLVDKDTYTGTVQNSGIGTITIVEDIPNDTPSTGTIIMVDTSASTEQVYAYTSWTGKVFTITGTTSVAYTGTDTAYVPYIYEEASSTSLSESVVYVSDRNVIAQVRKKGIQPFLTTGTFTATGYSVAAIRTTDSIVT